MISISTFIKKDKCINSIENINEIYNQYFVRCDDERCLKTIYDFEYIEGAIIIKSDDEIILDFKYWDIVDQLWTYMIDAVLKLMKGEKEVKFYFPDQPIEIQFQEISRTFLLLTVEERNFKVKKIEFILALLENAESFFKILSKCNEKYIVLQSKETLKKINEIRIILGWSIMKNVRRIEENLGKNEE